MYSLKVLKDLQLPDGRLFVHGHDAKSLDLFEVAELVHNFPDYFESLDEITADTIKDGEKMKKYAEAKVGISGELKKVKK